MALRRGRFEILILTGADSETIVLGQIRLLVFLIFFPKFQMKKNSTKWNRKN